MNLLNRQFMYTLSLCEGFVIRKLNFSDCKPLETKIDDCNHKPSRRLLYEDG